MTPIPQELIEKAIALTGENIHKMSDIKVKDN
jgi:predicted nucleic-acid-binding Zn-ribbon protein